MRVMIIEDDFRIANIHQEMIEQLDFCQVVHSALTAKDALDFLEKADQGPDLILLDMFIPDTEGLNLLKTLRANYPFISVIIASAANDRDTVIAAKKIGVYDYLVKPIEKSRLQEAFLKYKNEFNIDKQTFSQTDLDALFHIKIESSKTTKNEQGDLPKGIDKLTLDEIILLINKSEDTHVTTKTLVENIGISRSTARRYLEYLDAINIVQATLHYGQVGRPQRLYLIREQNEQK